MEFGLISTNKEFWIRQVTLDVAAAWYGIWNYDRAERMKCDECRTQGQADVIIRIMMHP